MPAKAKLTDEQVKKIRRRVRAGERLTDLAAEYGVTRKTIRRRLDALELADAERARRTAAGRAEEKRTQRLDHHYRTPGARLERARTLKAASPPPPSATAARRRASGGRILRLDRSRSYADWLDERDARVPAPPDPPVRLVTESGETIASTSESNAERMTAALEPRHGPLTVVPA